MYKRRIPLHGKNRFYRFLFLKGDIIYYKTKIGIRFPLTFDLSGGCIRIFRGQSHVFAYSTRRHVPRTSACGSPDGNRTARVVADGECARKLATGKWQVREREEKKADRTQGEVEE